MKDEHVRLSGGERLFKQFIDGRFGVEIDCTLKYKAKSISKGNSTLNFFPTTVKLYHIWARHRVRKFIKPFKVKCPLHIGFRTLENVPVSAQASLWRSWSGSLRRYSHSL